MGLATRKVLTITTKPYDPIAFGSDVLLKHGEPKQVEVCSQ